MLRTKRSVETHKKTHQEMEAQSVVQILQRINVHLRSLLNKCCCSTAVQAQTAVGSVRNEGWTLK